MNEYDDISENIHRCFGSLDHVFNAGRSEREASASVKKAIEAQGMSKDDVRIMILDHLADAGAQRNTIDVVIAESLSYFFDEPESTVDSPSTTSPNPIQPT